MGGIIIFGVVIIVFGVAMLVYARTVRKTASPLSSGMTDKPYDRARSMTQYGIGAIVIATVVIVVAIVRF